MFVSKTYTTELPNAEVLQELIDAYHQMTQQYALLVQQQQEFIATLLEQRTVYDDDTEAGEVGIYLEPDNENGYFDKKVA